MIVVDTSALVAVLAREPKADRIAEVLRSSALVLISAGTLAESLIVARRRGVGREMATLVDGMAMEVVPVTAEGAERAADAHDKWGKGVHPAGLTYGDCFAYALAMERACPLLFVGNDFAKTDVAVAMA